MKKDEFDISILREMAFSQYNQDDYFIFGDKVFYGDKEKLDVQYDEVMEADMNIDRKTFYENNCDEMTGIDEEHQDYLILTDEESNERVKEYIEQSVWAFTPDFIVEHTKLPYEAREMIENYQEKCEGANDTILALIEDFDEFVEDAISADGRGHFLSSFDGNEHEETIQIGDDSMTFYIYRT